MTDLPSLFVLRDSGSHWDPALRRLRSEDCYLEASLDYRVR